MSPSAPAAPRALVLGLLLAAAGAAAPRAQSAATPAAPPAAAPAPPAAEAVSFSCPVRGQFGDGPTWFSQFYEDYILSYVFQDTAKGTYVDVGAYDPNSGSVTKFFYLKGWRGVNVEPQPDHLALFQKDRSEDVNLGVGIADAPATLTFFKFEPRASGLSTFDAGNALRHRASGYRYEEMLIPVITLTEALTRAGTVKGGFEFLNVDVEGYERKVLSGLDFTKYPPKVIVLESTAPLTEEPTQQKWEDLLFAAHYTFALDDGLNRYYVQSAETALQTRFLEAEYCVARDKRSKGVKLDGFHGDPGR